MVEALGFINLEWDNSKLLIGLESIFALVSFLALGFLNTVFINSGDTQLATLTLFLQGLILFGAIIFGLEKLLEGTNKDFFETVGFGQNLEQFLVAIVLGAVFAFLFVFAGAQALIPAIPSQSTVLSQGILTLVFTVFFAATVEEFFFRGTLLPTLAKMLESFGIPLAGELALVLQAIIFGIYHLAAYGLLVVGVGVLDPKIITSMFFGLFAGIGNGLMRFFGGDGSTAFGYSLHLFTNFFIVSGLI